LAKFILNVLLLVPGAVCDASDAHFWFETQLGAIFVSIRKRHAFYYRLFQYKTYIKYTPSEIPLRQFRENFARKGLQTSDSQHGRLGNRESFSGGNVETTTSQSFKENTKGEESRQVIAFPVGKSSRDLPNFLVNRNWKSF
jgi:hypothetical protein